MNHRRRFAGVVGGLVGLALVAACAAPVPTPDPDPVPATPPASVEQVQTDRILDAVSQAVSTGDASLRPAGLEPRVAGPALRMRSAEYQMETAAQLAPVALGFDVAGLVVSATSEWPRFFIAVANPPEGAQAGRMYLLVQNSPQEQYHLWGWMRLMPNTTLPRTNDPEIGSEVLSADDASLMVPPDQVVEQFADVIAQGDASAYRAAFAETTLRDTLTEARQTHDQAVAAVGGTLTQTFTVSEEGTFAIRTADGGAIVIGAMRSDTAIALPSGKLKLLPPWAAVTGMSEAQSVEIGSDITVAFWVPAAGSSDRITVLGAEEVVVTGTATPPTDDAAAGGE